MSDNEIIRLKQQNKELVEALKHINEYWNRGENDKAMTDALYHIIEVSQQALNEHTKEG